MAFPDKYPPRDLASDHKLIQEDRYSGFATSASSLSPDHNSRSIIRLWAPTLTGYKK